MFAWGEIYHLIRLYSLIHTVVCTKLSRLIASHFYFHSESLFNIIVVSCQGQRGWRVISN